MGRFDFEFDKDHPKVKRATELVRGMLTARLEWQDKKLWTDEAARVTVELANDHELAAAFVLASSWVGSVLLHLWALEGDHEVRDVWPQLLRILDEREEFL